MRLVRGVILVEQAAVEVLHTVRVIYGGHVAAASLHCVDCARGTGASIIVRVHCVAACL